MGGEDLQRLRLTINQSKVIAGESYIVVNYTVDTKVSAVWVLWNARDEFFSAKKSNTNARSVLRYAAAAQIEPLYKAPRSDTRQSRKQLPQALTPAKASLRKRAERAS